MEPPNNLNEHRKALVIFWEGADWNLLLPFLQSGLLPNLKSLIDQGSQGNVLSHFPFLPTPLFVSALTGARVWRHGVRGDTDQTPLLPLAWDALPPDATIAVNVPSCCKSDSPKFRCLPQQFFESSQALACTPFGEDLSDLFVSPANLDAGIVRLLCPSLTSKVAKSDPLAQVLAGTLARHYTTHNVAASLLETQPWTLAVLRFDFLEQIVRRFAAFAAPNAPHVPEACRKRYGEVVKGACRLMDFLLGDILQAAGDTACFLLSTRSVQVLAEKAARAYPLIAPGTGFLVASGKHVAKGITMGAVNLLDLAPTLRRFWNLPPSPDHTGRPWEEILTNANSLHANGNQSNERPHAFSAPDLPAPDSLPAHDAFVLGVDLYEDGKPAQALPFLYRAVHLRPEFSEYAFWLSCACSALGNLDCSEQCEAVMLQYLPPEEPATRYRQALLASQRGQLMQTVWLLEKPAAEGILPPPLASCYARALIGTNQWDRALEFLVAQLERSPSNDTWIGMARCYLHFKCYTDAEGAARHVLENNPGLAEANVLLALALYGQERTADADTALKKAEMRAPDWPMVRQARATLSGLSAENTPPEFAAPTTAKPPSPLEQSCSSPKKCEYRAPDATEVSRFQEFLLAPLPPGQTTWEKRIWTVTAPYIHITAAAAWCLPNGESEAKVALRLCPAWLNHAGQYDRLQPLLSELSAAGAKQAILTSLGTVRWASILPDDPTLQCTWWTSEEWTGDPALTARALEPYLDIEADLAKRKWLLRPLNESDWPLALQWGPGQGYLEHEHFNAIRKRIDTNLSASLEMPNGTVAGLLLVTRTLRMARVEFIVGNPDHSSYWPLCSLSLFHHLIRMASQTESFDTFSLNTNLNRGLAMHRLAKRLKMSRTSLQSHALIHL